MEVIVQNPNNIIIDVDQGRAGRGIQGISYEQQGQYYYLVVTYTDTSTETLGPLVITGAAVSLLGGSAGAIAYQEATDQTTFLPLGEENQVVVAGPTAPVYKTLTAGTGIDIVATEGEITISAPEIGTVTSVDVSGGTTGLTFSGGPVTSSGTISMAGTLAVASGGTGATTAPDARTNLSAAILGANNDITSMTALSGGVSTPDFVAFDTTPETASAAAGTLFWDSADSHQTLALAMAGGNVTQQIGQETYYRIKATSAITEGQVVMFTGTVGASGALTGAPATGLNAFQGEYVMGVATENIAKNAWGYVTWFGVVRNINTTGGAETWADGDILYFNPAVPGGLTKNVPSAPNPKVIVASVVHAATNGSIFVRPTFGSAFGSTDSNVQFSTLANGDMIAYDSANQYWKNVAQSTLTVGKANNLVGGTANQIPYQTAPDTTAFSSTGTGVLSALSVNVGTDGAFVVKGGALGTPASGTLTNATGLPLTTGVTGILPVANGGTGISSFGAGVASALGEDVTGSGSIVLESSPTLTTPNLGTPSAVTLTNATGLPLTTGVTGILPVTNGGTGANDASGARSNLGAAASATTISAGTGLSGGGDLSANRTISIADTTVIAGAYGSASDTLTATVNAQGQLTALAATPIAIANTQISGLGTMSTQNANSVSITGGSISGITDLAVADGGTGASDASGARANLGAAASATTISAGTGLSGGGDLSANRTLSIADTGVTAASYGSAGNTLTATVNAQGQLTSLAATPIAIANTQVSGLGTMSTQNSNNVTISGGAISGITDLAIADGGTGASDAATARTNLGLGTAAVLNAGSALGVATLDAGGTVPLSQIPASIQGGVSYQGSWDAATNTPTIVSGAGSKGHYYVVSVAGSTVIDGISDWLPGDWIIFNGTAWEQIDNTDAVASVNGYTGVVSLTNTDVGAPPTSLTISAGTGLSGGGDLSTNRTLSIANTTVNAGAYGSASSVATFTVNGQGQLTQAATEAIAISNTQVSGLGTMSTQNANSVSITGGSVSGITDLAIADGGTGASTAAAAIQNLLPAYTGNANKRLGLNGTADGLEWVTDGGGTVTSIDASGSTTGLTFTGGPVTSSGTLTLGGTLAVTNGGTGVTTSTGSGSVVLSTSPTLTTPNLGTPSAATLTNATGLPVSTGISGLGTGVATALAVNTGTAGAFVVNGGALGTPSSGTLTNVSGLPLSTGVTGTLATTNGGTGLTSFTANGVVYASSTSALTTGSALTFDGVFRVSSSVDNAVTLLSLRNTATGGWLTANIAAGVGQYSAPAVRGDVVIRTEANSLVLGSDTAIKFGSQATEYMRLTSTGLGIGTSSPGVKLSVVDTANSFAGTFRGASSTNFVAIGTTSFGASINGYTAGFASAADLVLQPNGGNLGLGVTPSANDIAKAFELQSGFNMFGYANLGYINANAYYNGGWLYKNTDAAGRYEVGSAHKWYTAPSGTAGNAISFTQAMTLSAAGGLSVGNTTDPGAYALSVGPRDTSSNDGLIRIDGGSGASGEAILVLARNGTPNLLLVSDGSLNEVRGSTNVPLTFRTNDTERARISAAGDFGIGLTPSGSYKLEVSGTAAATDFNSTSDRNKKTNIATIQDSITKVQALRGVEFDWKDTGKHSVGLIAQEVEAVIPEAVQGEEGNKTVSYGNLVGLLIEAIKEQQQQISTLKAEVAALKGA